MKKKRRKLKNKSYFSFTENKYVLALFIFIFVILGVINFIKIANNHIYWEMTREIYMAAIGNLIIDYSHLKPFRNWKVSGPGNFEAEAMIVFTTRTKEKESRVIFEKNHSEILPIASLSKIFTAYIALKNYEMNQEIPITREIIAAIGDREQFKVGEVFTVKELLHSMLIQSGNDSTKAIAEIMGEEKFIASMNTEMRERGLLKTYFFDTIGLDPGPYIKNHNHSTVYELALFVQYILEESKNNPRIYKLLEISRMQEHKMLRANGTFHHSMLNTNTLLDEFPETIGAKTGQTPLAGECLIKILPRPRGDGYIIFIILGSNDRSEEMRRIINWTKNAFVW